MNSLLIENAVLVNPGGFARRGSLLIRDGHITAVDPASVPADAERLDAEGKRLTPGLIDMHTHGIGTFLYEDPSVLEGASMKAASFGTTSVYPTVVPKPNPTLMNELDRLTRAMAKPMGGAQWRGLHLEGPFMALPGAACPVMDGDLFFLNELIAACNGCLSIMSLSPETKNILPVIERLVEKRIVPFITHTRSLPEPAQAAIAAGARHATHFYDVFHIPPEIEPGVRPVGVVEALMADPRTTVDFIADGCHVLPLVIQAYTTVLGWKRVMLITDSNIGAGMPEGIYDTPWGYQVRVKPGDGARMADGPFKNGLAGSALTMDVGMENLLKWLPNLPAEQVWAMGTLNPARLMGLSGAGRLEPGAEADLVLWSKEMRAVRTWVGGRCVFKTE